MMATSKTRDHHSLTATAQRLRIETGLLWFDANDVDGFAGSRFVAINGDATARWTLEEAAPCVWDLFHDQTRVCRVRDLGEAVRAVKERERRRNSKGGTA